jgi:septal ring factor EnvC (AmiA/AmiB activator)
LEQYDEGPSRHVSTTPSQDQQPLLERLQSLERSQEEITKKLELMEQTNAALTRRLESMLQLLEEKETRGLPKWDGKE